MVGDKEGTVKAGRSKLKLTDNPQLTSMSEEEIQFTLYRYLLRYIM